MKSFIIQNGRNLVRLSGTGEGPTEVDDHELVLVVAASFFFSGIQLHTYRHWKTFSFSVRILPGVVAKVQRSTGV